MEMCPPLFQRKEQLATTTCESGVEMWLRSKKAPPLENELDLKVRRLKVNTWCEDAMNSSKEISPEEV